MRKAMIFFILAVMAFSVNAETEIEAVDRIAPNYASAEVEVRLWDGTRVDILTPTHAIEVDWADKWAEGIGQALYYAALTDREPMVLLLVENYDDDAKYIYRCQTVCEMYGIDLETVQSLGRGRNP